VIDDIRCVVRRLEGVYGTDPNIRDEVAIIEGKRIWTRRLVRETELQQVLLEEIKI
jgi:hypothetical protein